MANHRKYYHSEVVEFQNGDKTIAKQLTIKKLKLLNKIFTEHDRQQLVNQKLINAEVEARKKNKDFDQDEVETEIMQKLEDDGQKTYVDILAEGCVIALNAWGVKNEKDAHVKELDIDYVEENLDFPTMSRLCEIAGSMELGKRDDAEGKEG